MRKRTKPMKGDPTAIDIIRILLLLQGAIAVVSTLEVSVMTAVSGPLLFPLVAVNAFAAALSLWLAAAIRRHSRLGRRLVMIIEVLVILIATIDLLLSIFIAQAPLELVPVLTRFFLPVAVIRLLRRRVVKAYFAKSLPAPPPAPAPPPPAPPTPPVLVGSTSS